VARKKKPLLHPHQLQSLHQHLLPLQQHLMLLATLPRRLLTLLLKPPSLPLPSKLYSFK
jgi:hypothetical protein